MSDSSPVSRVAIVTGSASGIGLAVARRLAAQGAGVVLNGFGDAAGIEKPRAAMSDEFTGIALPVDGGWTAR